MIEIQSPTNYVIARNENQLSLFLAGSIEMGEAEDWQSTVISHFNKYDDLVIFNPRRDDWDSTWEQSINNPNFKTQVDWELDALETAEVVLMYFDPNTKSPISLLELGIYADTQKLIICCPDGFWRKGNVDIICNRYDIPLVSNMSDALFQVEHRFSEIIERIALVNLVSGH